MHTTDATVPDVKETKPIQRNLTEREVKPAEHYLDSGYPSADLITAAAGQGITMVTPLLAGHSPQAKAAEGFDKSAFRIDWKARQVHCPEGSTSTGWYPVTQHGGDAIVIDFARADWPALHTSEEVDSLIDALLSGPVYENLAQVLLVAAVLVSVWLLWTVVRYVRADRGTRVSMPG